MQIPVPSHIRGLVFDCDGTLVDSMPVHMQSWQVVLDRYGLKASDAFLDSRKGSPVAAIVSEICEMNGKNIDVHQFAEEKEVVFREMGANIQPISPVIDVVKQYHNHLPLAVASGSPKLSVMHSLEGLRLTKYFDTILTLDDGLPAKPAPDIFLEAARQIGVHSEACQVFEDGDLGLQAAHAAGMLATDIRQYL